MRLLPLLAAAALFAPAAALAHDMRGEGPPPPPLPLAGAPWMDEGPGAYGAMRGPPPMHAGAFCHAAHAMMMGPQHMAALPRFAGPPCGRCIVRRPVRLHDGWLSWPGKTYF